MAVEFDEESDQHERTVDMNTHTIHNRRTLLLALLIIVCFGVSVGLMVYAHRAQNAKNMYPAIKKVYNTTVMPVELREKLKADNEKNNSL